MLSTFIVVFFLVVVPLAFLCFMHFYNKKDKPETIESPNVKKEIRENQHRQWESDFNTVLTKSPHELVPYQYVKTIDQPVSVRNEPKVLETTREVIPPSQTIAIDSYTTGTSVQGNDVWLRTVNGKYIWSGAIKDADKIKVQYARKTIK